jgi:hypothetical protein
MLYSLWIKFMALFQPDYKKGDFVKNIGRGSKYYRLIGTVVGQDDWCVRVRYPDHVDLGRHPRRILRKVDGPVETHFNEELFNV